MFISKEQTKVITGYDVTAETLNMAQSVVEAYIGKVEAEVVDANDLALLGKATAYQAAYMRDNAATIFEQVQVSQLGQFGQIMSFRPNDRVAPFVAPLAVIACRNLTWMRSRGIKTGRMHDSQYTSWAERWVTE